jgi:hypothetical protein
MFETSLLELNKNTILRATIENDVLIATRVERIKNTLVALNFDTNMKPKNTGRWTRRGYSFIKNG